MKKLLAFLLVFAMCFGTLAACTPTQPEGTEPPVTTTSPAPVVEEDTGLADAAAYVKNIYKNVSEKTPQDFTRVGTVPVGDKKYEVVWTADVSEDLVKAVKNEDGTVTIDVNESASEDTPYVLTATITGSDGRTETLTWNHLLPASLGNDMGAIVDAAYGLADGEKLDGTYTLTGKIVNVDTAWSSEYKNITVTIAVEGKEDKTIQCYRLTGEDLDAVKALAYGDTITVSGTLKNYKGTIEFDAGCQLLEVVKGTGEGPVAPETYDEIVEEAYALGEGKSLPYTATLTGKVISIDYGYSEKYGDISLTFECRGKNFYCYRMTGPEEWLKQVGKGDWITVMGKIKNYYGTVEFDAGCKMIAYTDWVKAEDVGEANLVSELEIGDVIVMANGSTFMSKNASGSRLAGVEAEVVDDTVMVNDDMLQLTVSHNGTYYVFTDPNGKYLTTGKTGGNLTLEKELSDYAKWTVESAGDGVFYVTNAFAKYGGKLQQLEYYSGFTTYSPGTSDIYKIAFYKIGEGEAVEIPAEPEAPETPEEPAEPTTLTIAEAIALGNTFEKNNYSEEMYKVTGVIESITNTTYGNMYIQDAEGNKLLIYGLYNEDGTVRYDAMDPQPAVGDTITVVGIIGKYNEPQMKDAWMVNENAEEDETTLTIAEAIELGNTFEKNSYSEEKYEVTGVIESITSTTYGNMYIQDAEGNKLLIYGLYNEDGTVRYDAMDPQPAVGDTITVLGIIGKYNEPQMKNGWMTELVPGETGGEGGTEEEPFVKPTTPAEIVAAAYALEAGETLPEGPYTLTGVITKAGTYSTQYSNVTVTIVVEGCSEEQPIECFRLTGEGADNLAVGDTITVTGQLKNYNGTIEFDAGCTLDAVVKGETPEVPEVPEETPDELPSSLTYEFSAVEMTPAGDYSTMTSEAALAAFLESEDNNNLKSVEASRIYAGNNGTSGAFPSQGGMLKTGSSSKPGQLVLTFTEGVKVTKVEIKCHDWYTKSDSFPTNSNTVAVNGSDAVLAPYTEDATPGVLTFTLDGTSNVVTIDAANRVFIFEIVVHFAQ